MRRVATASPESGDSSHAEANSQDILLDDGGEREN